jgi:hypothetical protein
MQSSQALRAVPVVASLALTLAFARPLGAQARYRVSAEAEWFYQQPGGKRLARVLQGAELAGGETRGDWQAVTLDGWIFLPSVGPTARAGFDLAVTRAPEENLRATPAGVLIAKLPQGFALSKVADDHRWVHVQRSGWIQSASLEPVTEVASARSAAPDTGASEPAPERGAGDSASSAPDSSRAQPARRTALYRAPEGPAAGSITAATPLRVLSRSGDWTRVQFEGWVKTADLESAPAGVLIGVSAAELRADPQRYVGQTLRWSLQFIAVEKSDELRPEIPTGATYLLARGPLPERGFVYVVVPAPKQILAQALTPLTVIQVTARVRAGRSRYLGNPVVDLMSLEVEAQP